MSIAKMQADGSGVSTVGNSVKRHIHLDLIYLAMCISSSFLSLLSCGQPGRRNSISCTSAIPGRYVALKFDIELY